MKILSEDRVRVLHAASGQTEISIGKDCFVTKDAKRYAQEQGIRLITASVQTESQLSCKKQEEKKEKPEHLTHLNGTVLVLKSHPRILLRGKLDSFQAKLLQLQILAEQQGEDRLLSDLGQVLDFSRQILIAEVTEKPLPEIQLLGMTEQQLRQVSQNPKEHFGVQHAAPDYRMGLLCIELNALRAQSREVELAAITAFCNAGEVQRQDLLTALNRLSSAIYILFCRQLAAINSEEHNLEGIGK